MRIEVTVRRPDEEEERHEFVELPVRIGRSGKNDVALLEPYVSENHGLLGFEGGVAHYLDLGSANGTFLNGKRLAKNEPVEVGEGLTVTIGILTVSVRTLAETVPARGAVSPSLPDAPVVQHGQHTIYGYGLASPAATPSSLAPEDASGGVVSLDAVAEPTAEISALMDSGALKVDASIRFPTPLPSAADPSPENIQARSATPPSQVAHSGDESRSSALIRTFCETLIALRDGFEATGHDLGVRPFGNRSPVHTFTDPSSLVRYLLDDNGDLESRIRSIKDIFGDFARHQVAMMAALDEGVRAVLSRVDPRAFEIEKGSRFLPTLDKENWRRLVGAFQALDENDRELHETLFGAEFAQAYAAESANGGRRVK